MKWWQIFTMALCTISAPHISKEVAESWSLVYVVLIAICMIFEGDKK